MNTQTMTANEARVITKENRKRYLMNAIETAAREGNNSVNWHPLDKNLDKELIIELEDLGYHVMGTFIRW
jgi:hypothetical protein